MVLDLDGFTRRLRGDRFSAFVIILAFVAFYGVSIITKIKSAEFMGVDESSITEAIKTLLRAPYYNMLEPYHTKFYGWSYVALNTLVLAPLKFCGIQSQEIIHLLIRLILFLLSLSLIIVFYFLSRRLFGWSISLVLALMLMCHPVSSHYFTTIHPETMGVLCYLIGLIYLTRYIKNNDKALSNYIGAVFAFSISSLSKQPFFFICFVALLYFPIHYSKTNNIPILNFCKSLQFFKLLMLTAIISLMVGFIIHPYAFFEFEQFLNFQRLLLAGNAKIEFISVMGVWLNKIVLNPIVILNLLLVLLPLISSQFRMFPFVYSVVGSIFLTILFVFKARTFINIGYLYPLYPIYLLNISFAFLRIAQRIRQCPNKTIYRAFLLIMLIVLMPHQIANVTKSVDKVYSNWLLEALSTERLSWDYIEKLPADSKISYLPTAAVPESYRKIGCHVWQGCGNEKALEKFSPDYVFASWDYPHYSVEEWRKFINNNNYKCIASLVPDVHPKYRESEIINENGIPFFAASLSPMYQLNRSLKNIRGLLMSLYYYKNDIVCQGWRIDVYKK